MARVRSTRVVRKRAPVSGASILSASALNTRIHRILNAGQELKRYSSDSGIAHPALSLASLAYVNPCAGITQGTQITQRIGDSITIFKIVVTARWYPSYAGANYSGDMCLTWRNAMIKIADTTLVSPNLVALPTTVPFTFAGFSSTGMLNNHDNTVISDKKKTYLPTPMSAGFGAPVTGGYKLDYLEHTKVFKGGHKITFKSGTNQQVQENLIMVLAGDMPGSLTAASHGTYYYAYNVFFRDG